MIALALAALLASALAPAGAARVGERGDRAAGPRERGAPDGGGLAAQFAPPRTADPGARGAAYSGALAAQFAPPRTADPGARGATDGGGLAAQFAPPRTADPGARGAADARDDGSLAPPRAAGPRERGAADGGLAALFAPLLMPDGREGGAADVRDVAFGQVDTSLSLRVRFWGGAEPACVVTQTRRICLDGKALRVNGRRIAADVADGTATFSPVDAGLARGRHDWWLETATDRVPDAGTFTTRVKVLGQPRCFGAAGRNCHNPRLRGVLIPTPAEAPLVANAPCRLLPRHGVLTPCEFGVTRHRTGTFVLIGDSHAATWRAALEVVAQATRRRGISITRPGCPFSMRIPASPDLGPDECRRLQRQTLAYLRARPSIHTIFVSSWAQPPSGPHGGTAGYGGDATAYAALLDQVPRSVRRIYVLRDNPGTRAGCVRTAKDARRCAVPRKSALTPDPLATVRRSRVRVIDLTSRFCDAARCFPVLGGAYVYKDDNHMNRVFSTTLGPYVLRKLRA